jgi:serine/threonine-protein kinase
VPQVVKLTENAAKARLAAGFLRASGDRLLEYDDNAPPGTVLAASPAPGEEVDNDTVVTLTISRGPQPIDLPDTSGRPQPEAVTMLRGLGFKTAITQTFSDKVPASTVISQNPPGGKGKQAGHGQTITLTVSKGPRTYPVPNVFGKRVNEATETLTQAGFQVTVKRVLGGVFGTVRSQSPAAGSQQPKGTMVTVTVV